ncbi:MAG TPA: hypothetical protein DEA96_17580 [Leptospiraceae bacterium]|nr:hypothetical protein [Spirochaetaceae bacterium]HBS06785.1 hypothetical protein [Leptospiraceae bacterium]|tara:strand:- start:6037 stop:8748 length:2712 start_codon:yes stop_codon:yes gene_type:complete
MRYKYYIALLTFSIFSLGCLGSTGAGDSLLFGTAFQSTDNSCTSDVTVTYREISLLEDGDVTATFDQAQDKGIAETDVNGGTSWGYRSFETCIYPNVAFSGSIEFSLTSNDTYSGRINSTRSFPVAVNGEPLPTKLTFTDSGVAERQCFTFTRVDDGIRNTPESPLQITMGRITELDSEGDTNTSGSYHNRTPCSISVTMDDDEGPGIRVSNISNVMEEPGVATPNSGTFSVVLRTAPLADVVIPINDTADSVNAGNREGTTSPTSLTFTTGNWNVPQNVTVTSVDDLEVDGIKIYTIAVQNTSSSDSDYNGIDPRDVVVYNRDQSVPGYTYERFDASGGSTDSSGGTINGFATDEANQMGSNYANWKIRLRSKPSANVTLNFSTTCGSKCNLLTTSLTFTPSNWNSYQTVQVEGASDAGNSGNADYNVTFNAVSSDSTYNTSVTEPTFRVRSCDNDASNLIHPCNLSGNPLGTSGSRFSRSEGGTSEIWLIAQSAPGSDVTVNLSSSDAALGGTPNASATITSANYNTLLAGGSNRVIMSHANDDTVNSPTSRNWNVITATSSGGITHNPVEVYATTTDDEQWFYVNVSGSTSEDTVTTATISVCLGANNPTQPVTVNIACNGDECGSPSAPSITFPVGSQVSTANASNSGCPNDAKKQTFTVTGADDAFADGTQSFSLTLTKAATTDTNYSGAPNPSNPNVNNADNEPAGKAIFVTSMGTSGEMTAQGVQGADNLCNTNKPGYAPSGTYKALIVSNSSGEVNDRTTLADWPINSSYYYYLCTGSGSNCRDENKHMFQGSSFDPMNMLDHSSSAIYFPSGEYWTGMDTGLLPATQASTPGSGTCNDPATVYRHNCHGFTYETCPTAGAVDFYGQTWSVSGSSDPVSQERACTSSYNLICVQQ